VLSATAAPAQGRAGAAEAAGEEEVRLSDYSADEITVIQALAARFAAGHTDSDLVITLQKTNLDEDRCLAALRTLQAAGLISQKVDAESEPFADFEIMPTIVSISREIDPARKEASAPKDIVEQITNTFRSHPWTAWPIVIILGLTVVFTFVNQLIQLLKNVGLMRP
jgi:hypothetical protein